MVRCLLEINLILWWWFFLKLFTNFVLPEHQNLGIHQQISFSFWGMRPPYRGFKLPWTPRSPRQTHCPLFPHSKYACTVYVQARAMDHFQSTSLIDVIRSQHIHIVRPYRTHGTVISAHALSTLSQKSETVAENGETTAKFGDCRTFVRKCDSVDRALYRPNSSNDCSIRSTLDVAALQWWATKKASPYWNITILIFHKVVRRHRGVWLALITMALLQFPSVPVNFFKLGQYLMKI